LSCSARVAGGTTGAGAGAGDKAPGTPCCAYVLAIPPCCAKGAIWPGNRDGVAVCPCRPGGRVAPCGEKIAWPPLPKMLTAAGWPKAPGAAGRVAGLLKPSGLPKPFAVPPSPCAVVAVVFPPKRLGAAPAPNRGAAAAGRAAAPNPVAGAAAAAPNKLPPAPGAAPPAPMPRPRPKPPPAAVPPKSGWAAGAGAPNRPAVGPAGAKPPGGGAAVGAPNSDVGAPVAPRPPPNRPPPAPPRVVAPVAPKAGGAAAVGRRRPDA
jgi:hypothetical protein